MKAFTPVIMPDSDSTKLCSLNVHTATTSKSNCVIAAKKCHLNKLLPLGGNLMVSNNARLPAYALITPVRCASSVGWWRPRADVTPSHTRALWLFLTMQSCNRSLPLSHDCSQVRAGAWQEVNARFSSNSSGSKHQFIFMMLCHQRCWKGHLWERRTQRLGWGGMFSVIHQLVL